MKAELWATPGRWKGAAHPITRRQPDATPERLVGTCPIRARLTAALPQISARNSRAHPRWIQLGGNRQAEACEAARARRLDEQQRDSGDEGPTDHRKFAHGRRLRPLGPRRPFAERRPMSAA